MYPHSLMSGARFFALIASCVVVESSSPVLAQTTSPATQMRTPNFVFFLVDDLGYTDIGCYGSTFYETPNIDRLAEQGVRFTNAYAACQVCSPSRAAIMSGKYPARLGTTNFFGGPQPDEVLKRKRAGEHALLPAPYQEFLDLKEVTIAETLKQNNYRTFIAGKWHLGEFEKYGPLKQGFDVNKGGYGAGHPQSYFSPYKNPRLTKGKDGEYLTDRLASETVSFISENSDGPFFVYLPFYSVHIPLQPRPDLLKKYEAKRDRLGLTDRFTSDGKATVRVNHSLPKYASMVEAVDEAVGRVVDALTNAGVEDNTVVIFTSDNGGVSTAQGWPTSNMPLRTGKGWMYEGGVREPLIVKWPGVTRAGSVNDSVVIGTDFYPTMLEMAGLPLMPEQHLDGVSMAGILKEGGRLKSDRAIFWHYPHYADQGGGPSSSVRDGDWKLIRWYDGNRTELFNLNSDPGEQLNMAAKNPGVVKDLDEKLDQWLKSVGAKYPTHNPKFEKTN